MCIKLVFPRQVNLFVEDGTKLGLMVRGGAEYGLGIYIASVDSHSLAEKAGLKVFKDFFVYLMFVSLNIFDRLL